jgi:hypothetical protein
LDEVVRLVLGRIHWATEVVLLRKLGKNEVEKYEILIPHIEMIPGNKGAY